MADVDFGDMLDYLGDDGATRAILLYVEGLTSARKFMSAARAAARRKPVLVVKVGRHAEAARAARSHTGALAGSDKVYDAAFRRAGMLRVDDMAELFDALETLSSTRPQRGDRLAILTNGGGPGVLATDALIERGGTMAKLSPESLAKLDAALPRTWSRGNPVDLVGDADAARYQFALEVLLEDREVDAVLVINCPTAMQPPVDSARAVVETVQKAAPRLLGRNVLANWLGEHAAAAARQVFAEAHIANYETPDRAVRGFMHRVHYRRNQELLLETPPSRAEGMAPDAESAGRVLRKALAEGREWLEPQEAAAVLTAYGIPLIETRLVPDAAAASEAARAIGGPVALKIRSRDIQHKSDIGGVALNLGAPERVEREAQAMLERVRKARPEARIEGFVVQEMVQRPGALELIVGVVDDTLFGPVILFGQGGTAVEVLDDTTLELPPLNMALARAQMARTRVFKLMQGYRNTPPADIDAVAEVLIRISQMVADLPEVAELDINPLLADAAGVIALDARLRVRAAERPGAQRLAIRPYPKELESDARLPDGTALHLRPIRPEDEPALVEFVSRMAPEDARLRFFTPMKGLSHEMAARLTQIDYDREVALVAEPAGAKEIWGVVRYAADPDMERAEYAITVRSDMKGRGLGYLLMSRMLEVAKARGLSEIFGSVMRENEPMLKMCRELGFAVREYSEDPDIARVVRKL
jgi:acetyltransferase